MIPSFVAVKDNFAHHGRTSAVESKTTDDDVMKTLNSLEKEMDSLVLAPDQEAKKHRSRTLNLSRQVFMATQHSLDGPKLGCLLRLYEGDQSFATRVLPIVEESAEDLLASRHLQNLPRSALREMLMESTDDFTATLNLVGRPGIRILGGLIRLDREGDKLLQEFFDVCREPNEAEIEMLAQACRISMDVVMQFFTLKRAQLRRLFVMQGLANRGSRLGTKLRMRECQLKISRPLRLRVPPEFCDPNLNEGWFDQELVEVNDIESPDP